MGSTGVIDKDTKTEQPSQSYIDGGIDEAQNYANTHGSGDTPIAASSPSDSSTQQPAAGGGGSNNQPSRRQAFADKARRLNDIRRQGVKNTAKAAAANAINKIKDQAVEKAGDAIAPGSGKLAVAAEHIAEDTVKGLKRGDLAAGLKSAGREIKKLASIKEAIKTGYNWLKFGFIIVIAVFSIVAIFVALVLIVLTAFLGSGANGDPSAISGLITPSTVSLSMRRDPTSESATPGERLTYIISVKSTVPTTYITVTDSVPENTHITLSDNPNILARCPNLTPANPGEPINENTGFYCEQGQNKTVTWKLTGSPSASAETPFETSLTVIFQVNSGVSNVKIFNFPIAEYEESTTTDNSDAVELPVGP